MSVDEAIICPTCLDHTEEQWDDTAEFWTGLKHVYCGGCLDYDHMPTGVGKTHEAARRNFYDNYPVEYCVRCSGPVDASELNEYCHACSATNRGEV